MRQPRRHGVLMSSARNEDSNREPAQEGSRAVNPCRKVVGLVPAPEMSAEMAEQVIDELPELLTTTSMAG